MSAFDPTIIDIRDSDHIKTLPLMPLSVLNAVAMPAGLAAIAFANSNGVVSLYYNAGGGTTWTSIESSSPSTTTLSIVPSSLTLQNGTPVQLNVQLLDSNGNLIGPGNITWSSNNANIRISSTGLVTGVAGSQTGTITASSSLNPTNGVATALVTTVAPVLSAISITPTSSTLTSGTETLTGATVDQFGQPISTTLTGGSVSVTNNGFLVSAAAAGSLATATTISLEWRMRADELSTLVQGSWGLAAVDDGTTISAAGHTRMAVVFEQTTGSTFDAYIFVEGVGTLTTAQIPATAFVAGTDVVFYACAGPGSSKIAIYDGTGTNTLIHANAIATSGGIGTLPTVAGGGFVRLLHCYAGGVRGGPATARLAGVAAYNVAKASGHEDTPPASGDSGIQELCSLGDATTGTTPSTSVASVGQGMVLPTNNYTYTPDGTTGSWNGGATTIGWTEDVSTYVTIGASTGVVTFVSQPGLTNITATVNGSSPVISGKATVTTSSTANQPDIVNGYSLGVSGPFPHQATTTATATNPGGVVTWGGPSDPGVSPPQGPGAYPTTNAAFTVNGVAMQFADAKGADAQFGQGPVGKTSFLCIEWESYWGSGANAPVTTGNFKFCRTRQLGYANLQGSLIVQNNQFWLYWDYAQGGTSSDYYCPGILASTYCDGQVHRFRLIVNGVAAPNEYIQFWIDGTMVGNLTDAALTATGATYIQPPANSYGLWEFYETTNNTVGGVRQIGRVWAASHLFTSLP